MTEPSIEGMINEGRWTLVRPLLPKAPRKGALAKVDQRAVLAAIVYVIATEGPWEDIPEVFGVPSHAARRRFLSWTDADLWRKLNHAAAGTIHTQWALDVLDAATKRAGNRAYSSPTPVGHRLSESLVDEEPSPTESVEHRAIEAQSEPYPSKRRPTIDEYAVARAAIDRPPTSAI